jgi:hypothetical protein
MYAVTQEWVDKQSDSVKKQLDFANGHFREQGWFAVAPLTLRDIATPDDQGTVKIVAPFFVVRTADPSPQAKASLDEPAASVPGATIYAIEEQRKATGARAPLQPPIMRRLPLTADDYLLTEMAEQYGDFAERQLDAVISRGRFSERFAFDNDSDEPFLEQRPGPRNGLSRDESVRVGRARSGQSGSSTVASTGPVAGGRGAPRALTRSECELAARTAGTPAKPARKDRPVASRVRRGIECPRGSAGAVSGPTVRGDGVPTGGEPRTACAERASSARRYAPRGIESAPIRRRYLDPGEGA